MACRRVLIVTYFFPPAASVGAVRPMGLARFLPKFGWEPVILTPRDPARGPYPFDVIETGDRPLFGSLKRGLGGAPDAALKDLLAASPAAASPFRRAMAAGIDLAKALLAIPDQQRGWLAPAERAAGRAIRAWHDAGRARVDAVLATGPPFTAHVLARRLAATLGVPWVADFRDLWADNHNSTAPAWRCRLDRRIERRTLRDARALVTVSSPLAQQLATAYPHHRVATILNGFDPDDLAPLDRLNPPRALAPRFTITHTGTFYQGRRDPSMFLATLAGLFADGRMDRRRVEVRFFSRHEDWVLAPVRDLGLEDVVRILPWAPRVEAIAAQRDSHLLLLLHWGGDAERGVYTGKIFEYLAARRPVLVVGGGPGVLADLVAETGAGVQVSDRAALTEQLVRRWREFESTGTVAYAGREKKIAAYSHERMAREFAWVLDSVAEARRTG